MIRDSWLPPEWRGRSRIDHPVRWQRLPEHDVGVGYVQFKREYGHENRWFLYFRKFNEGHVKTFLLAGQTVHTASPGSTVTITSDATWNNSNNTIEVIGGGGSASHGASNSTGGGGGGGGAYTKIVNATIPTPGTSQYYVRVGAGGGATDATPGEDSWWTLTAPGTTFPSGGTAAGAKGGAAPATSTSATGAAGGALASAYASPSGSSVKTSGGNGANGTSGTAGGGGGGAGGAAGNGANGSGTTGGAGNAATGGGGTAGVAGNPGTNGGAGTNISASAGSGGGGGGANVTAGTGGNGGNYGGGGGGGTRTGGNGGQGIQGVVVLTWAVTYGVSVTETSATSETLVGGQPTSASLTETAAITEAETATVGLGPSLEYNPTYNTPSSGWSGYTVREVIKVADYEAGGAAAGTDLQLELDLTAGTAAGTYLYQCIVGKQQDQTLNLVKEATNVGGGAGYGWSVASATSNQSQADAFGGTTGATFIEDTATNVQHYIYQSAGTAKVASSLTYTSSFYLRPNGRTRVDIFVDDGGAGTNGFYVTYDLSADAVRFTGTYGSGFTVLATGIEPAANSYHRCWVTYSTNSATIIRPGIELDNSSGTNPRSVTYTGDGVSGIYFCGPQTVLGSTLTPYVPVQTYNFEGRYNLVPDSATSIGAGAIADGPPNYGWDELGLSAATTGQADIKGGTTATHLIEDTSTDAHETNTWVSKTASAPETVTVSFYAYPGTRTAVTATIAYVAAAGVTFDLATGTVGATNEFSSAYDILDSGMQYVTGGWYRCWFTVYLNTSDPGNFLYLSINNAANTVSHNYTGNGTGDLYVAHPMVTIGTDLVPYDLVHPYNYHGVKTTLQYAPYEKMTGTLGASQVPNGWTGQGIAGNAPSTLVDAGTVDGLATYASQIRMTAAGGYQGILTLWPMYDSAISAFKHGTTYTLSCYIRIPTGVTASAAVWNGPGVSNVTTIASAATLNAQTKDVWVKYQVSRTWDEKVDFPQIAIINPADATGTGFDICRIVVDPPVGHAPTFTQASGAQKLLSNFTPYKFDKSSNLVVQWFMQGAATDYNAYSGTVVDSSYYYAANNATTNVVAGYAQYDVRLGVSKVYVLPTAPTTGTYSVSITETSAATETNAGTAIMAVARTESVAATEVFLGTWTTSAARTESAAATEAQVGTWTTPASRTESAAVAETNAGTAVMAAARTESAAIAETNAGTAIMGAARTESAAATETNAGTAIMGVAHTETAAATETPAATWVTSASRTETAAVTETAAGPRTTPATLTETQTPTETVTGLGVFPVTRTEALTPTDDYLGVLAAFTYNVDVAESAVTSDLRAAVAIFSSSMAEVATATDVDGGTYIDEEPFQESVALSTIFDEDAILNIILQESVAASAVEIGGLLSVVSFSDSIATSHTQVGTWTTPASRTETAALTEAESAVAVFSTSQPNSVTPTETQSATAILNDSRTESAAATETNVGAWVTSSSRTETVAASETYSLLAAMVAAQIESAAAVDLPSATAINFMSLSDSTATSDAFALGVFAMLNESAAIAETISTALDVYNPAHFETAAVTGTLTAVATMPATSTELSTTADALIAALVATRSLTETLTTSEVETAFVVAVRSLTETATPADSLTAAATMPAAGAETVALTEESAALAVMAAARTETAALTADEIATAIMPADADEALSIAETMTAPATKPGTLIEIISSIDTSSASAVMLPALIEALATSDTFTAAVIIYVTEIASIVDNTSVTVVYNDTVVETSPARDVINLGTFYDIFESVFATDKFVGRRGLKNTYLEVAAITASVSVVMKRKKDPKGVYITGSSFNQPIIGRDLPAPHIIGSSHVSIIGR